MEQLHRDIRYAVRVLLARRVFSLLAIACLALGIGATAAIFSVVNGVLLKPLPFPHADRLVAVGTGDDSAHATGSLSAPDFVDYRASATRVELGAWGNASFNFRGNGTPTRYLWRSAAQVNPEPPQVCSRHDYFVPTAH